MVGLICEYSERDGHERNQDILAMKEKVWCDSCGHTHQVVHCVSCHHNQLVPLSLVLKLLGLQHSHQVTQCLVQPLDIVGVWTVGQGEPLRHAEVHSNPPHQLVLELGPLVRVQDLLYSELQQDFKDQGLRHGVCVLVLQANDLDVSRI